MDFEEAWTALKAAKTKNRDDPEEPPRLPLAAITELDRVFQIRGQDGRNDQHVAELAECLSREGDLDPITVWRFGAMAFLIDGHHRLAAYRRRSRKDEAAATIPVVWLRGTPDEALQKAASANAQVKLPLTAGQRHNFAWRLVVQDVFSKAVTAKMAGVSEGNVAAMRRARKKLDEKQFDAPEKWAAARAWMANRTDAQIDYDTLAACGHPIRPVSADILLSSSPKFGQ